MSLSAATILPASSDVTLASEPVLSGTDRRVQRTKRVLRDALAHLMVEYHGLEGFTVGDLTQRADINRGTFYAHYADKYDLLHSCEDELLGEVTALQGGLSHITLVDVMECLANDRPLPFAVSLYDYLRENGDFIGVLLGRYGDAGFQARLRDTVSDYLIESVLPQAYRVRRSPLTEYYISYYASAQLGVIQRWFTRGMVETSEQMARMVLPIMFMRPGDAIAPFGEHPFFEDAAESASTDDPAAGSPEMS